MTDQIPTGSRTHLDRPTDPLCPFIDAFLASLTSQGYAASTVRDKRRLLADFGRWLGRRRLGVDEFDERTIASFLQGRRRRGFQHRRNAGTLWALVTWLRDADVVPHPAKADGGALHTVELEFAEYLARERGLAPATRRIYLPRVQRFLRDRFGQRPIRLGELGPSDVVQFIERHARNGSRGETKLKVTALRSFLRFLRQRGDIAVDLAAAVPCVANWRLASLPKTLEPDQVEHLLHACDRSTTMGRRDYAVLLLLARLGLRAGEVVSLTLDDLDWESGTIVVRGKGPREDRMPLPSDVGEALAAYLRDGRKSRSTRRVFVRARAPHRGFASSVAICTIVRRSLARAGLEPPRKGAHLLRHTLATQMLRGGASLREIGDVLRHRRVDTTAIYAKVDLVALRSVARPWPGGGA